MTAKPGKFRFAIDRGGTFTDVFALCPDNSVQVMKLLSVDPKNYRDAPVSDTTIDFSITSIKNPHLAHFFLYLLLSIDWGNSTYLGNWNWTELSERWADWYLQYRMDKVRAHHKFSRILYFLFFFSIFLKSLIVIL